MSEDAVWKEAKPFSAVHNSDVGVLVLQDLQEQLEVSSTLQNI